MYHEVGRLCFCVSFVYEMAEKHADPGATVSFFSVCFCSILSIKNLHLLIYSVCAHVWVLMLWLRLSGLCQALLAAELSFLQCFKIQFKGMRDRDEDRQDVILHPTMENGEQRCMGVTAVRPGTKTGPTWFPRQCSTKNVVTLRK